MNAWQSVCAAIVVLECAALGFCALLLTRTYLKVKGRSG